MTAHGSIRSQDGGQQISEVETCNVPSNLESDIEGGHNVHLEYQTHCSSTPCFRNSGTEWNILWIELLFFHLNLINVILSIRKYKRDEE